MVDTQACKQVVERVANGEDIIDVENEIFETNHADMGFLLAKKWQLSVLLANCIKYHHDPASSSMAQITTLAYVADVLSHEEPDVFDEDLVESQLKTSASTIMGYRDEIFEKAQALFTSLNAG